MRRLSRLGQQAPSDFNALDTQLTGYVEQHKEDTVKES